MKKCSVPIAVLAGFCLQGFTQEAEVKPLREVTYRTPGGIPVRMDAYLVKNRKPAPALIFIHGGGWRGGDKQGLPAFLKKPLFDAGISIISINYRLTGQAPYPAQVDDCTRAVQFVRTKAKQWNINPDRIALMGTSAGGNLSLWVGLHDDRRKPDSPDPVERRSSRVSCIVDYYAPVDFRDWQRLLVLDDSLKLLKKDDELRPVFMKLFGRKPEDLASSVPGAMVEEASPILYVTSDDPPVLTVCGTGDKVYYQALALIRKLNREGVESESCLLPGGNHGLSNRSPDWPDFETATIDFLKKHLLK